MPNKQKQVEKHLRTKKSITSLQAFQLYTATRLAAIIFDLRKKGWDIVSEPVVKKQNDETVRYVKYKFVSEPKAK